MKQDQRKEAELTGKVFTYGPYACILLKNTTFAKFVRTCGSYLYIFLENAPFETFLRAVVTRSVLMTEPEIEPRKYFFDSRGQIGL